MRDNPSTEKTLMDGEFQKTRGLEKAHALSLFSHKVAMDIRGALNASLKNQIVRAALSIPTNIVEGPEQKTDAEFARYLRYALASTSDPEYHANAAPDIGAITTPEFVA